MSITDDLRAWWVRKFPIMDRELHKDFTAIADRIDAEHESKVSYWQGASYKDGYDEGFASADDWLAQHEDAMAEHGWVRLPMDADGEYIHAGDKLDGYGKTIEVVELRYGRSGWVLISRDGNAYADTFAFAHHHSPTVEDVLLELLNEAKHFHSLEEEQEAIAEYAKKLRLSIHTFRERDEFMRAIVRKMRRGDG